jgi:hypothetical protein
MQSVYEAFDDHIGLLTDDGSLVSCHVSFSRLCMHCRAIPAMRTDVALIEDLGVELQMWPRAARPRGKRKAPTIRRIQPALIHKHHGSHDRVPSLMFPIVLRAIPQPLHRIVVLEDA